ncbi:MAG TPA: nuclear transport factor 2 family protein [Myxococcota bacterium]|nr:nuclear transport factor 2 family protein [Myxococcota bacterium]
MAKKKKDAKKSGRSRKGAPRKKGAARKASAPSVESLARKIVRLTEQAALGMDEIKALYNEDCVSQEGTGQVDRGYAGLEAKGKRWDQMQSGSTWKATNVWVARNTICIEWDSTVNTRDGRTVKLPEIAVHEIKNGKIQNERFYYNPMALAPPQGGGAA